VTTSAPGDFAAIVATLRAAGCVFAEDEARLLVATAKTSADLVAMVDRRGIGFPLEHVLGWAEFCGLRIAISDGVFVPRRRSEFLVRQALAVAVGAGPADADPASAGLADAHPVGAEPADARQVGQSVPGDRRPVIVDLCCGSGAIGIALATALHGSELHAADIEPAAVECARRNVVPVGGHVWQGDLYNALPGRLRGRIDILVVNAPYVPTSEIALMPAEARLHEPAIALDGGGDGVAIHRRVATAAPAWLAPDGHLFIETSTRQAALTAAAVTTSGLIATIASDDDMPATVVIGSRTPVARP
jgi:release factor glutamine methyltransferase